MKLSIKVYTSIIVLLCISAIIAAECDNTFMYTILKPLASAGILCIPILFRKSTNGKYFSYTVAALAFCLMGDILLLREERFILGLVSFLIGHVLFILSFLSIRKWKMNWPICALLAVIAMAYFVFIYPSLGQLQFPVLAYVVIITTMSAMGVSIFKSDPTNANRWLIVGVLLFMDSDMILAYNKFVSPIPLSSLAILSTYWIALYSLARRTTYID